jgi:ABC-type uncharacterized transport system substrate-binding protein
MRSILVAVALLAYGLIAEAQQTAKVHRIGHLMAGFSDRGSARLLNAFRQGMGDFGYIEGKHFIIEPRWGEGDDDRLPALAADLVRLNVDIIVAAPTKPAIAAHHATKSIPIVVAHMSSPAPPMDFACAVDIHPRAAVECIRSDRWLVLLERCRSTSPFGSVPPAAPCTLI